MLQTHSISLNEVLLCLYLHTRAFEQSNISARACSMGMEPMTFDPLTPAGTLNTVSVRHLGIISIITQIGPCDLNKLCQVMYLFSV